MHLLNPMRLMIDIGPLLADPSGMMTTHLLGAEQAELDVNLVEPVAVLKRVAGLVAKDLVHFLEREPLRLGDEPEDEGGAQEAHCAEEDEGSVAHLGDHEGCRLSDLGIRVSTLDVVNGGMGEMLLLLTYSEVLVKRLVCCYDRWCVFCNLRLASWKIRRWRFLWLVLPRETLQQQGPMRQAVVCQYSYNQIKQQNAGTYTPGCETLASEYWS